ncbi:MAG: GTP pyrophosphokinase [Lachnospiraceae bacterium]|nr:GTP pyrophosphokinase [Lachnospiraceae bacterium]
MCGGEAEEESKDLWNLKTAMDVTGFQTAYESAVDKAVMIVRETAESLERDCRREILSSISGRVKKPESIRRKLIKKKCDITLENVAARINDIAGIRATCYFLDDVHELAQKLKIHPELHFLKEKNYIEKPKSSGYKSLHLIVEVPIDFQGERRWVKAELQLRTLAMDFWARLDHRLCYKKDILAAKAVQKDLKEYAEIISRVDSQMLDLRKRIDAL